MFAKILIGLLAIVLIGLQYRLWSGEGSIPALLGMQARIAAQTQKNDDVESQNKILEKEVAYLKNDNDAVEGIARSELGWIKEGETLYRLPAQGLEDNHDSQ